MSDAPEPPAAPAAVERRIITVVFADLVGFTSLSERLDAEDVATMQDAYFAAARETVQRHGGFVEKFIGDAAMGVFGIPRARDDDAERAVRAALSLVGAIEQIGARLGFEPGELRIRVGVNTGEVVLVTSGPDAGRITGDTVNTAARLQTASTPNRVLVGELTALAVGESVRLEEPIALELKGKSEPVRARMVAGLLAEPSRDVLLGELRAPMLGRDEELATLEGALGRRITVIAPPGVGKSRLAGEVAARAEARGEAVLRARVRPQAATPYEPVAELLRAAGAETDLEAALADRPARRRTAITAEVDALLRPTGAEESATTRDVTMEREVRFGAWVEALDALIGKRRSVWLVEDVHWAGGDLLAFLKHATAPQRIVICTSRPSILDTAADWVAAGDQLELATLPAADAIVLVRAFVGDALQPDLVRAIAERSDGNPLFIEELLRTWVAVGALEHTADGWRLAVAPDQVSLPGTVQAIYAAQLDDLPDDARLVARRASVAGRRFRMAALTPLELADGRDGLETLRRRAFLAGPHPDPVSGDVYAYRHALLRDAGYASLARAERARLHLALARWLEEGAGPGSGEVAQLVAEHYAAASDSIPVLASGGLDRVELAKAAAGWFERAAAAALTQAAPESAARLLARSLELTDPGSAIDLARRRLRRGEILADSAALDEAVAAMTEALDSLGDLSPDAQDLYGEAAYHLGLAYMQQIRFSEAEALTSASLERLSVADVPAEKARLMALHAWAVAAQGRNDGAGEEAQRAVEIGNAIDDPMLQVDLLEHYAATSDELGTGGPDTWEQLSERATAAGRWRQAAIALRARGMLTADQDPAAALQFHDRSADLAEAHGLTEQQGWADLGRCEVLFVIGDWDAALEAGERALRLSERYAYERLAFRTWVVVLPMLAARADPSWSDRYHAWWASAAAHFPTAASPYGEVLQAAIPHWLVRAAGQQLDEVAAGLANVPLFTNPHFVAARETLAEVYITVGDLARATSMAGQNADDATELMRASQALIGSWVAAAAGELDQSRALAREAADHARASSGAWWLARALRAGGVDADAAQDIEARLGIAETSVSRPD